MDCICTIVYGFNCDSLTNRNTDFQRYGNRGVEVGSITSVWGIFLPEIIDFMSTTLFDKSVSNFFIKLLKD